jgi:hypothetical protein
LPLPDRPLADVEEEARVRDEDEENEDERVPREELLLATGVAGSPELLQNTQKTNQHQSNAQHQKLTHLAQIFSAARSKAYDGTSVCFL